MQVEVVVKCMQANFDGCGLSGFRDFAPFQILLNFPFKPWTIVHGGQKIEMTEKVHAIRGGCESSAKPILVGIKVVSSCNETYGTCKNPWA